MSKPRGRQFSLILRDTRADDSTVYRRLAALLKHALRAGGFRCEDHRELKPADASTGQGEAKAGKP